MDMADRLRDLQRTFVAPRGLATAGPRPVRLTIAGRVLTGIAILGFAGAVVAGLALSREARRQAENRHAIVERGVTVQGEVMRLWPSGERFRRVRYRFIAGGTVHENQISVSTARRRSLDVGSTIAVRYLPDDPTVNDLGGTPRNGLPLWLPPLVSTALVALGVLCLLAIARQRRLLSEGRAAPAVVTGTKRHSRSHGGSYRTVMFEFPLLNGAIRSGKRDVSRKAPEVGSVICVIYDPDRPTRCAIYPLALVQPGA